MFQIDLKSRKAVFDQIVDNFKRLISSGVLSPGEYLPGVKEMAKTLTVNPNTIQKAYFELEHQNFLRTEDGKDWSVFSDADSEETTNEHEAVSALYGRIHADIQELIARGEVREDIGKLLGMGKDAYIQVEGVTKKFESITALDGLNLNVKKGSIYGLVGVNGSGKTTTLKLLAGAISPDEGLARIDSMPCAPNEHGKIVGYMQEDMYFLPDYTLKMLKSFIADKYKSTWNEGRFNELAELFGLTDLNANRPLTTFSRGMQKQAGFALAISSTPDVLLLDETIDGFDPIVRKQVFKFIIEDISSRDMTVIITSHNMRELDGFCDTIGILKNGHMILERDLDDLRRNVHKLQVAFPPEFLLKNFPYDGLEVLHMEEMGSMDILVVRGDKEEIAAHIRGYEPLVYDHLPMTLEEIFIYETEGERE
ncbi:MAG: ATP-binding cassette domain-containing protein [Oscillospiraceae bacterium]|nr:ATP-binding cassette domain-containing protein [Oscillospiraceae bacterium]MCL2247635.1 ATP-binding cassette domain-containing protein [Oscillospiraceae bacterium]